ncbi:hypothetical protein AK830_g3835 [Neonectria ditissima]|uniref:Heterokaryon incompatibility domain-containing protein n=1 Tax=Neonectria ditissima TaxID=78410 RepID=A0A0P7BPJ0_9HYPO|nr:hypothetical protein AK830_g3835 [Neonectria ditissima]
MAHLCELCESVIHDELPPFPDKAYTRTLSGKPHFQHLYRNTSEHSLETFGFRFHPDLDSLRRAAENGCDLCRLIESQADAVLSDIAGLEEPVLGVYQAQPTFDLYITKRADDGDGFWVLSSATWKEGKYVVPVAAISFGADEGMTTCKNPTICNQFSLDLDDPLAAVFKGRLIKETVDAEILERVRTWTSSCDKHERCSQHSRLLPSRIIDVGTLGSGNSVKLVEPATSEQDNPPEGKYIALSYCWGTGSKPYVTTQATLDEKRKGIDMASLPTTFLDAITLSRTLGIQYLWIDSLCICQDHISDWERESSKMAAIYANAYLTIAASGANSSEGGLFFSREPPATIHIPRHSAGSSCGTLLATAEPLDKEVIKYYHVDMQKEPLTQRAWGFQERVLSRRVLHFAKNQLYYECLEGTVAENGLKLPNRFHHASEVGEDGHARSARPVATGSDLTEWYGMLWAYGPRKLSVRSDKLPALTGIAKIFQERLEDEYLAGLWKKSIHEGLCWQPLNCHKEFDEYRAPSWSWASVDGIPATGFRAKAENIATITDCHTVVDGENPFGQVKDGWIKMEAPLVSLVLSQTKGPTGHIHLRCPNGDEEGAYASFDTLNRSFSDSAEELRNMKLFALVIAKTDSWGKQSCGDIYHSLIVSPTEASGDTMKRLGIWLHGKEQLGPNDLETRTAIKLV